MTSQDVHNESSPGMATLVSGILSDAQDLIKHQFTLFRQEMHEDVVKAKKASNTLAVGVVFGLAAGIILSAALALLLQDLLHWSAAASFGLVGLLDLVLAGILVMAGVKKLETMTATDQSIQAAKENIQWLMKK
jgi:high-affinity Fe2+/Pb2+ permease